MDAAELDEWTAPQEDDHQTVPCPACDAALQSPSRTTISFLLLDQLTIPLLGCSDHVEQFRSVCELTTEERAELLDHRPAGGINCPGCQQAGNRLQLPTLPVGRGAVAVLACESHQSEIIGRFQGGLQARQSLTASLRTQ